MKTCVLDVVTSKGRRRCRAFLDEGSSVTLMDRSLANELGLSGPKKPMDIKTMSGITTMETMTFDLKVKNIQTGKIFKMDGVTCVPSLNLSPPVISNKRLKMMIPELQELQLPELDEAPKMLIGLDFGELIAARELRKTKKNGPLLQRTLLGWTVTGKAVLTEETLQHSASEVVNFLKDIGQTVDDPWNTEQFGCKYTDTKPRSLEDRRAEAILDQRVHHNGERWVAPLLRRDETEVFPDSFNMAEKRARSLEKGLQRSPDLSALCHSKLEDMVRSGHFRKLSKIEAENEPHNTWYLPLLTVTSEKKPGKVRLVLDAAAKSSQKCLNDFLMQGPDNMNSLTGVLLRWREKRIGLCADVKAMFSQILMASDDKPSLRFLWRSDNQRPFDVYESPVLIFGAKSSPSIAGYCYRRTADEYAALDVARLMKEDTYVDDVVTGTNCTESAIELAQHITTALGHGGFQLNGWTSNAEVVNKCLGGNENDQIRLESAATSTLGVAWQPRTDILTYETEVHQKYRITKRGMMSQTMKLFDPLGFLSGWILTAKQLLQQLWSQKCGWDDEVPDDLQRIWDQWNQERTHLEELQIPRHVFMYEVVPAVELHVFCDASQKAFCAVCYFRWQGQDGIKTNFVMARVRVAPLKTLTIPRLELQSAVLGTRLAVTIIEESRIKINRVVCWSDSQTTLSWIKSESGRFNTFVNNRVAEIREATRPGDWRYVPSSKNAADAGSRGQTLAEVQDRQWLHGPSFLCESEENWPKEPEVSYATNEVSDSAQDCTNITAAMPDIKRFSSWGVAVRTVCVIRRWITKYRDKQKGEFSAEEVKAAEFLWVRLAQAEEFKAEIEELTTSGILHRKNALSGLSPLMINGMLVVDSRVCRSPDIDVTSRYPPILPSKHTYTSLLMLHYHKQMAHQAHSAVLTEIRQRYWIPKAASTFRKLVSECQLCRIRKAKPISVRMAPLPLHRVTRQPKAFASTGIDTWGPLTASTGRALKKVWVIIFRCLTTKAVHFEMVETLTTDSTLMAISRFQNRRGNVHTYFSDNGRNFVGANRELIKMQEQIDQEEITRKLALQGIRWKFNTPTDASAGGVWERNIRTAKDILHTLLRSQTPRYEVLTTLLTEVERIMNSTPLVEVPLDAADDDPITPYHFLIGRATPYQTPVDGLQPTTSSLRQQWKVAQEMADHFWRKWTRQYLPRLATRTKWRQDGVNLKEGSIVIVTDETHPRNVWVRGRVESVVCGPDGRVRAATVKTKLGTLRRPVRKLIAVPTSRPE